MSADLNAPGARVVEGTGGGTSFADPLRQTVQIDQTNKGALPITFAALGTQVTDGSGTITVGGTAQLLFGGATPANGFLVQNTSDDDLWISDVGTASAGGSSLRLPPRLYYGGRFMTPLGYRPPGPVSIFGATAGLSFAARYW